MTLFLFYPENCIFPLGLESGEISDEAITHSVNTDVTLSRPSDIRLNKQVHDFPFGWQAAPGVLDFLQVNHWPARTAVDPIWIDLQNVKSDRCQVEMFSFSKRREWIRRMSSDNFQFLFEE